MIPEEGFYQPEVFPWNGGYPLTEELAASDASARLCAAASQPMHAARGRREEAPFTAAAVRR